MDYNEDDLIGNDSTWESYKEDETASTMKGSVKFGYALLGFVMGVTALLVAWLINDGDRERVKQSVLFSLVGVAANWILAMIAMTTILGMVLALVGSGIGTDSMYHTIY